MKYFVMACALALAGCNSGSNLSPCTWVRGAVDMVCPAPTPTTTVPPLGVSRVAPPDKTRVVTQVEK